MAMIELQGVTKKYKNLEALKNVSFGINQGDIFGYIGPNGAGKTTTIKILATLLLPNEGTALIDGIDVVRNPMKVREIIGYMPDFFGVYDEMKSWEYLDFFAACYRIPKSKRVGIIDDVLELTDLTTKKEAFVHELSRGMKQRLCLARCLVHDPKVLLLDEPASGLDPRARIELRELLKELGRMGKTILVSSHILTELADFCNVVGIIEAGEMVLTGRPQDILKDLRGHVLYNIKVKERDEEAKELLLGQENVEDVQITSPGLLKLSYKGDTDLVPDLMDMLKEKGIKVLSFSEEETDLEDLFMRVTKGIVT
ncbi:MAG TPA: ABC transporter ATP-binding protein [bacterium]|jgi:ABC-2 type transport system ATP-binding protein